MKLLFIFGTRPEAIKMAPIIIEAQTNHPEIETCICTTGQHREMLDQILSFFNITADVDLNIMKPGQDLFDITSLAVHGMKDVLIRYKPDIVLVQGDTTTAFAAALAAFYCKVSVAHVEAGLRTFQMYSPFPEEINRKMISQIATWHFAPTQRAVDNLRNEGISKNVFLTGNTVIDALFSGLKIIKNQDKAPYFYRFKNVDLTKRIILITGHRRESFGGPFQEICKAIRFLAESYPVIEFIYPVHLNPQVQKPVHEHLKQTRNIHLMDPLTYPELIWIMEKSYLILTDSGGIQEEAPSLGKPVVVMREFTERMEGIESGNAILSGTNFERIINVVGTIIDSETCYQNMVNSYNPYGNGHASQCIIDLLLKSC